MTNELILQGLETLIQNLSIDLRYEKGDFKGGLCKIKNQAVIIINDKLPIDKKIKIMAKELKLLNLEQIYIRPALRKVIEQEQLV